MTLQDAKKLKVGDRVVLATGEGASILAKDEGALSFICDETGKDGKLTAGKTGIVKLN